jgi:hypothetical protein
MLYKSESTLPWFVLLLSLFFINLVNGRFRWGFFIACALSSICILFFGPQFGITGFNYDMQPVIQMLGGYLHPGRPMANMYFVLFGTIVSSRDSYF